MSFAVRGLPLGSIIVPNSVHRCEARHHLGTASERPRSVARIDVLEVHALDALATIVEIAA